MLKGGDTGILLIHGYAASSLTMRPLAHALNESGYTVFCPLLPGHGTKVDNLEKVSKEDYYKCIEKAYRKLEEKTSRYALHLWFASGQKGKPQAYLPKARYEILYGKAGQTEHRKWAEEKMHSYQAEKIGILCLAEDADNILMWSHYAENHTGFCVRFDTTLDNKFFCDAKQVNYHPEYPILNWWKSDLSDITYSMIYNKSNCWSYEKEWRIMGVTARKKSKFRAKAIDSIILGCKTSNEHQQEIMDIVKTFPFRIKVYKATLKETQYALELKEIG